MRYRAPAGGGWVGEDRRERGAEGWFDEHHQQDGDTSPEHEKLGYEAATCLTLEDATFALAHE
ncbi:hypothetical protein [Natrialbaceae archaeon AArc-T1-2]|uniref:hypothetical protein n=1 Tax=Natrialbaceae archaeon AArc-T1-2 TaxID=3053904 RepID=UPI00255A9C8C|nr:hypothetical protein [Natrialbaceae archaeon AArc-T1-2]WIV68482.1 hypothetical protein QQ977_07105 [Natrialbaceae archaeon AArc-T1-2]